MPNTDPSEFKGSDAEFRFLDTAPFSESPLRDVCLGIQCIFRFAGFAIQVLSKFHLTVVWNVDTPEVGIFT